MRWLKSPYIYTLLALLSLACLWYAQSTTTLKQIANQITENLEVEVKDISDFSVLQNKDNTTIAEHTALFVFKKDTLIKWSDHTIPISYNLVENAEQWKLVRIKGFIYLVNSERIRDVTQVRILVLQRDYPVQNKYLRSEWNSRIFPKRNYTILDANANLGVPIFLKGQCVFRISTQDFSLPQKNLWVTFGFSLLLLNLTILSFLLSTAYVKELSISHKVIPLLLLLLIRVGLYFFLLDANFTDHFLFSPETFASSTLNPSLADLLLNIFFLLYFTLFFVKLDFSFLLPESKHKYKGKDFFVGFILAALLFAIFYFPVALIQTITHNSAEDFSLATSIRLNAIRILSFTAWLISVYIALLWFLKVWKLFQTFSIHKQRILLSGAIAFSFVNYSNGESYLNVVVPVWIFLLIVDWRKLEFEKSRFDFTQFIFLFLFSIVLAVSSSIAIQNLEGEKKRKEIDFYVDELKNDRDIFAEYLLQNVVNEIRQDIFIQTRLNSPLLSKDPILSKIEQAYLSGYLSRYKKEIHLYAADGTSFTQTISLSSVLARNDSLKESIEQQSFYVRKSGSLINGLNYLVIIPVLRNQTISGYISISLLSAPTGTSANGYPEIWMDERWNSLAIKSALTYAIVNENGILATVGNFNRDHFIKRNDTYFFKDRYSYYTFSWRNNEQLVFQIFDGGFGRVFMNTCYLVVVSLFLIVVYFIFIYVFKIEVRNSITYSSAIQFIINLAFLIPLVVISIYVLFILDRNSKESFAKENESRLVLLANQFKGLSRDSLQFYAQTLFTSSKQFNEYFDLYTDNGLLIFSNKPLLRNNLLPQSVGEQLKFNNGIVSFYQKVGAFSYQELYTKIPDSKLVISTPVYQSTTAVSVLQSKVLNSVIPVFLFVFCLLLWISTLVSAWLIKPFSMFQKSFADTNLDTLHKSLSWNKKDEVALVVNAFNNMLQKLEESKNKLELLKREEAWREVAQQVAHEIKNPLTPMKLSLQRMLRNVADSDIPAKKTLEMLVEQVEVLDTIASSFSSYAKMPKAFNQPVNLKLLVEKHLALFSDQLKYQVNGNDIIMILADEKMLIAVLNNLLLNAIQSTNESEKVKVDLDIRHNDGKVLLQLQDNGKGIPKEIQSKLFQPHFTTKTSGSGLGLAFAYKMMEAMNGNILLKHSDESGTTFLLEFISFNNETEI